MRKLLIALAALTAAAVAAALSFGSSHREAPGILKDPYGGQHGRLGLDGSRRARQPHGRRQLDSAGRFRPAARTSSRWTRTGPVLREDRQHGRRDEDVATAGSSRRRYRNQNSFLYAAPQVTSVDDTELNLVQTYDLYKRRTHKHRRLVEGEDASPTGAGGARQRRAQDDPELTQVEAGGVTHRGAAARRLFPGQRDDPFFVDLGAIFDGINVDANVTGNQGGGKDDLSWLNTKSFVLQVPEREVTRDRKSVVRREGRQRRGRRVVDHRAQAAPGRRAPRASASTARRGIPATAGSRSRASGNPSSTR